MKYFIKESSAKSKVVKSILNGTTKAKKVAKGVEITVTKNGKKVKTFVSDKQLRETSKNWKNKITGSKKLPIYK